MVLLCLMEVVLSCLAVVSWRPVFYEEKTKWEWIWGRGWGGDGELQGVEGRETGVGRFSMKEESVFNNNKKVLALFFILNT